MENLLTRGMNINRDLRFLRRFWFILETAASCGFRELVHEYFPEKKRSLFPLRGRKKHSGDNSGRPARIRKMLEELGPTFVKLGQILSTRPDIVGPVYAEELKKLTEQVTPFKFSDAKNIIIRETGKDIPEIFSELDPHPLAAASIGQVHLGRLAENGEQVVVKVRRPGVEEIIREDLEIMKFIASRIEQHGGVLARHNPRQIVDEFAHQLTRELDYMTEAANLCRFARDCDGNPDIKVARVYLAYTTSSVMTMEFINGDSAAKIQQDPELRKKYDLKRAAESGVNSLLHQIFIAGFFHADPHPGNIILLPDNRISFIDFGMMGRIGTAGRRIFLKTLEHMLENNIPDMVDSALQMTITGRLSGSRSAFERDAAELVDANINLPLEKLSLARILSDLMKMLDEYGLALRPELYMMFKSLITIEHLGKDFDPELRIVDMVKPFLAKVRADSLDPRRFLRRFLAGAGENLELCQELPGRICSIVNKAESGELSFQIEHHRLNDMEETLYVTGERLSRSVLLAALLLGSALIITAKIPPVWQGIPLPGAAGFIISGFLSVCALWSDHRQRARFLRERQARKMAEELRRRRY